MLRAGSKIEPCDTRCGPGAYGDADVLVQMSLVRIIVSEINDQQVIFLREVDGERAFPILIGLFEATSIDRRVRGELPPRPLTHDLLKSAIEQLGGEVQDVVINNLENHTYYAAIRVRKDGELIEIDARPSDAVALAVHYEPYLPIYVADSVLEEVAS
jgi:uncharacterized protein